MEALASWSSFSRAGMPRRASALIASSLELPALRSQHENPWAFHARWSLAAPSDAFHRKSFTLAHSSCHWVHPRMRCCAISRRIADLGEGEGEGGEGEGAGEG